MRELFTEQQIETKVKQLAAEISADFEGKVPILIGVLNGSFIFMADLVRELSIECEVDFIKISSYEGTSSKEPFTYSKIFQRILQEETS